MTTSPNLASEIESAAPPPLRWTGGEIAACENGRALAEAFEQERGRLVGLAHHMLGSRADAEDAVQDAWLRLARQDTDTIDNLAGWLTTVVSRVCIDVLRARNVRRESPWDQDLPELVVTEDEDGTPEGDALLSESVGLAMLVVLDSLRPAERLAFVLHDLFAVPFREIGEIVGKSTDATKMLASRARRKVRRAHPPTGGRQEQRAVVDAFLAAAHAGDFEGLLRVLDPDVTLHTHTERGVTVKLGAADVARTVQRGHGRVTARRVLVNGEPGILAWGPNRNPLGVMACVVVDGRIVQMRSVTGARRLAAMALPALPA